MSPEFTDQPLHVSTDFERDGVRENAHSPTKPDDAGTEPHGSKSKPTDALRVMMGHS